MSVRRSRSFGGKRVSGIFVMASGVSNEGEWRSVGTPLEPLSPEGQFLCGILKNQPHIFRVAASEQLKELALERESAFARWEHSIGSSEHPLHGLVQLRNHSFVCFSFLVLFQKSMWYL